MVISQNGGGVSTAHVNMMTDTIIANLPADGLRVVVRSLLVLFPEITRAFEHETKKYITQRVASSLIPEDVTPSLVDLGKTQQIARSMLGCGLSFESLQLFQNLVNQGTTTMSRVNDSDLYDLEIFLTSVDGDIVQAMTAVQKSLLVDTGARVMNDGEHSMVKDLYQSLMDCHDTLKMTNRDFPFGRSLVSTAGVLGLPGAALPDASQELYDQIAIAQPPPQAQETFQLNGRKVPRIFSGLWQMSSPAWGAASSFKIVEQFSKHVQQGFTAFDMADHYGDAEVVFVCGMAFGFFSFTSAYTAYRAAFHRYILIKTLYSQQRNTAFSIQWLYLAKPCRQTSARDADGYRLRRLIYCSSIGSL